MLHVEVARVTGGDDAKGGTFQFLAFKSVHCATCHEVIQSLRMGGATADGSNELDRQQIQF